MISYFPDITVDHEIEGHRSPTPLEIKYGWGAIHYRTFPIEDWLRPGVVIDNNLRARDLKKWILADDGLRYYR